MIKITERSILRRTYTFNWSPCTESLVKHFIAWHKKYHALSHGQSYIQNTKVRFFRERGNRPSICCRRLQSMLRFLCRYHFLSPCSLFVWNFSRHRKSGYIFIDAASLIEVQCTPENKYRIDLLPVTAMFSAIGNIFLFLSSYSCAIYGFFFYNGHSHKNSICSSKSMHMHARNKLGFDRCLPARTDRHEARHRLSRFLWKLGKHRCSSCGC